MPPQQESSISFTAGVQEKHFLQKSIIGNTSLSQVSLTRSCLEEYL